MLCPDTLKLSELFEGNFTQNNSQICWGTLLKRKSEVLGENFTPERTVRVAGGNFTN